MTSMRWRWAALLAGVTLGSAWAHAQAPVAPPQAPVVVPAASESARSVLARVQPSVVQIKGFFGTNSAQAFHGTGLFVTNYHVVAEQVQYPDKFRLEYKTTDDATGRVEVLAVDVRHDLALVHTVGLERPPLKLDVSEPARGARAYAVGFPLDVGLTITEGVSNGKVEDSFEARIHYSGAVNAGMSGGPALGPNGDVIGANVSGYLFQQLVSFLVPAAHIEALIASAPKLPPPSATLQKAAADQMRQHSAELLGAIKGPLATQTLAGYALPAKIAPFINCGAAGAPVSDDPVQMIRVSCGAKAGLHVQQGLSSGDIRYEHYVLATEKLDAWRFAGRLSALSEARGNFGNPQYVAPFSCDGNVVALKNFEANVMVCTRAYRNIAGIYDFVVRISSLDPHSSGFASHLDMYGLEFDGGMAFIRAYLDAMSYGPVPAKSAAVKP